MDLSTLSDEELLSLKQANGDVTKLPDSLLIKLKGKQVTPYTPKKKPVSRPVYADDRPWASPELPEEQTKLPYPDTELAAAKEGVNIDATPNINRTPSTFAANEAYRLRDLTSRISKQYPGTEFRPGPAGLEFINPNSGEWQLVDPSTDQPLLGGGKAIPAVGELIGGIGGAALAARKPWGWLGQTSTASAGAGLGAGMGEGLRQYIGTQLEGVEVDEKGKPLPVNPDMTAREIGQDSALYGGKQAAWDMLFAGGAEAALRFGRWWVRGSAPLSAQEAQALINNQKEYAGVVAEINRGVGGPNKFQPSAAQMARNAGGGDAGPAATALGKTQELSRAADTSSLQYNRNAVNEYMVQKYFDNAMAGQQVQGIDSIAQAGSAFRDALQAEKDGLLSPLQQEALNAGKQAYEQTKNLPEQLRWARAGELMRETVSRAYVAENQKVAGKYKAYRDLIGQGANSAVSKHKVKLPQEYKDLMRQYSKIIEQSALDDESREVSKYLLNTPEFTMDLAAMDRTLAFLRAKGRKAKTGEVSGDVADWPRERLEKVLAQARYDYVEELAKKGKPEIKNALYEAEAARILKDRKFEREIMGDMLAKGEGGVGYRLKNPEIFLNVINKYDATGAQMLSEFVRSNPAVANEVKQLLFAHYRDKTFKNGVLPDYQAHQKYMNEYFPVVKNLLEPEEWLQFRRFGSTAKLAVEAQAKLDAVTDQWNKSFKGQYLEGLSAEGFVKNFFGDGKTEITSAETIRKMRDIAARYGEGVLPAWKSGIVTDIIRRTSTNDTLDVIKMQNILDKYGDKLEVVLGPKFVKQLTTATEGLKVIRDFGERGANLRPLVSGVPQDVARTTIAPPLSAEGRLLTMGANLRTRAYPTRLWSAMYNPEDLKFWADQIEREAARVRAITGATVVGGSLASFDD